MRWTTPGTLNDPYDIQFDLHIDDIDHRRLKENVLEKLWEGYAGLLPVAAVNAVGRAVFSLRLQNPGISRVQFDALFGDGIDQCLENTDALTHFQDDLRPVIAQTKILCLARNPTSALMWSHYAEVHQGIALRFISAAGVDSPWCTARPVRYRSDMPRLFDFDSLSRVLSGRGRIDGRARLDDLIYTKGEEWAYEQEWRICSGTGRDANVRFEDVQFNALELDAVILGCRMRSEDRARFVALVNARYPHAQVLQIRKHDRQFRYEIAPLSD